MGGWFRFVDFRGELVCARHHLEKLAFPALLVSTSALSARGLGALVGCTLYSKCRERAAPSTLYFLSSFFISTLM